MSEIIFILILSFVVFDFVFERLLEFLNSKKWSEKVPEQVAEYYDSEKYFKSQLYHKSLNKFSLYSSSFSFVLILVMLLFKGFAYVDEFARSFSANPIIIAIIFFGVIAFAADVLSLPFQIYHQFVIEKKFEFNKTTPKIFIVDKIKSWFLAIILGGTVLTALVWLYSVLGEQFWIYAWMVITAFTLFITLFYSNLIVPLFNKQVPIEEGELKKSISTFAQKVGFEINNIYVIDGSKRSTKANAYFTGLGKKKRIVLYDTLINNHTTDEIVAVLAHEIGHYKKKHTWFGLIFSFLQTGVLLFVFSFLVGNINLANALGAGESSFHIALIAFGMLYGPVSMIIGTILNVISRKNEFSADRFAGTEFNADSLRKALIKLSANNLSNLTPHFWLVFFHYSHPPLLKRIDALNKITGNN